MIPNITALKLPNLLDAALRFPCKGNTQLTENNLFCLKVDDSYIHQLFPILEDEQIKKPNYFGSKSIGGHITIIYPEENRIINADDLQQEHHFLVKNIVTAEINQKTYYVLLVDSPSLLQLRKKYHLPELLCFKGYSIGFHITIGVKI